jgi:hypothetical protein
LADASYRAMCLAAVGEKFRAIRDLIESIGKSLDWSRSDIDEIQTELDKLEAIIANKIINLKA